jgi:hypothetical protein
MKLTHHKRLLPFQQKDENDVINLYSLNKTGIMGEFVSVESANLDDEHGWNYGQTPGAEYDRAYSQRYETKLKVRPCASGDKASQVLGLTLFNTLELDENGEKYLYYPQKAKENHVVVSGRSVPVATKGVFTISASGYSNGTGNLPQVGDLVVPSNTEVGKVAFVAESEVGPSKYYDSTVTGFVNNVTDAYYEDQVLGKVIGTGVRHGGYAMVKLDI